MRGLLAIECLYHQIIAGAKTQTRRSGGLEAINDKYIDNWRRVEDGLENGVFSVIFKDGLIGTEICKARYRVGEVMYLKEPISTRKYLIGHTKENGLISETWGNLYKYSGKENHGITKEGMIMPYIIEKWSNKLFIPASAARAFIKITGIRCERLLDISDEDCIAEGIETIEAPGGILDMCYKHYPLNSYILTPKNSFLSLYKFANKVKEIDNIWVWVYTFEYLKDYKL